MTVAITSDSPQLNDKLHILREEAEILRALRDQLTVTNSSLLSERDQLLLDKEQSDAQQAACHYKIQRLSFDVARLEADRLSSSMIEDISTFDSEILSTNESIIMKMYEISEFERKQYVAACRNLATALRESIENSKRLQSQLQDFQSKSEVTDIEARQQCDKLNAEKSKLKEMLKTAKDAVLEAQSLELQRKGRIYELETEVEILKQQVKELQGKKLDKAVQQLKDQLKESNRQKVDLENQLTHLRSIEVENAKLKEQMNKMRSAQSQSMGESIGRIKSAINSCDQILKRKSSRKPNIQVSTTIFDEKEEDAEEVLEDVQFEMIENFEDSDKASKKDPNWSDLEENTGRKRVSKKRKQQLQNENVVSASDLNNTSKPSQPRKLFVDRAKGKMFNNSPGLSSVDNPFTDMLQLSGSVASIKDKNKRSRTRCIQKQEVSQPIQ